MNIITFHSFRQTEKLIIIIIYYKLNQSIRNIGTQYARSCYTLGKLLQIQYSVKYELLLIFY